MNTQETTCTHPQLRSWHDVFPSNWYYLCTTCSRRVTIPIMHILMEEDGKHVFHRESTRAARRRMVDMIGEAFGEQWREKVQREANQWDAKE